MTHPAHTRRVRLGAFPIERYRASIIAAAGFVTTLLLQLSELMVPGRPLGGIELLNLVFAAMTLAAVYWPADPWAKFVAAIAGAVGQTVISGWTDGRFTTAEIVTIAIGLVSAIGVGALPNAPVLVVEPAAEAIVTT